MEDLYNWLINNRPLLILIVAALLALVILQRFFGLLGWIARKARRMGKPAELHPKLQAYGGYPDKDLDQDKRWAAHIVATSSTGAVAGYEVVRQIEAVYVEGYRTPADAVTALKAAAARQGGNAIIHLLQGRNNAGRISAQGDAVVIEPTLSTRKPPEPPAK